MTGEAFFFLEISQNKVTTKKLKEDLFRPNKGELFNQPKYDYFNTNNIFLLVELGGHADLNKSACKYSVLNYLYNCYL